MRASIIFAILGLLALLATMAQASRSSRVRCHAAIPECGHFRTPEEAERYWARKKLLPANSALSSDEGPHGPAAARAVNWHSRFLKNLCRVNPEDIRCIRQSVMLLSEEESLNALLERAIAGKLTIWCKNHPHDIRCGGRKHVARSW